MITAGEHQAPEIWLPIPGYEGIYEASSTGQIRSFPRGRYKGGALKQIPTKQGYRQVTLSKNGEPNTLFVHSAVAAAFHGPRPQGLVTRHLDGDPSNNAPANLKYGTDSENARDRIKHGRHNQLNKTHCPAGHPFDEANTRHLKDGSRACRTCRRAHTRAYALRKKAAR